jgi:hypothetical protein
MLRSKPGKGNVSYYTHYKSGYYVRLPPSQNSGGIAAVSTAGARTAFLPGCASRLQSSQRGPSPRTPVDERVRWTSQNHDARDNGLPRYPCTELTKQIRYIQKVEGFGLLDLISLHTRDTRQRIKEILLRVKMFKSPNWADANSFFLFGDQFKTSLVTNFNLIKTRNSY